MSEYGSEIVLIEPAPPLLQLECENCVNGPLVANFGSSSPYENITCKLLVDNQFVEQPVSKNLKTFLSHFLLIVQQKIWYILVSQFTENENGNRILLNTEVFDSTKKNTFFTLSPGRLDYFQGMGF